MKDEPLHIPLPSLIRRIGGNNAKLAKQLADANSCAIKRIRRSRNWQLIGSEQAAIKLLKSLRELQDEGMRYLVTKLDEQLKAFQEQQEPKHDRLLRLVSEKPNITLNELIEITDCTLAEARLARFESEL
ncbi:MULTISPECIES: ribosome recycling factor family protein [unclassified Agarivorans]|uniref:ribosome recycling factor family protein n=1 Tax=unclassified Agarivorans TaxID=2636026 RepID=UPI0026E23821|nr:MULTISPECIES: ribosome recycling factor family protein [unclassified Agarivorans]MDO6687244.1 ribosome recycling factor family protein [Agarivorans sp. 3_MG-2023]MDO6716829.1 ribosome recycling factor family protein [Agarivorans sp. 2_MG-2023]